MRDNVQILYKAIDYEFSDTTLLNVALTHKSASKTHNERLEFLGDSILNFIISKALYEKFKASDEGELSRLRAHLVQKEALSQVATMIDLGNYINLGMGERKSGGAKRKSILADTFEALIAAVYIDSDYDTVTKVLLTLFSKKIDSLDPDNTPKDAKTKLQEYLQARQLALPTYKVDSIQGEPHEQVFTVTCIVNELHKSAKAHAPSRREAEQIAAGELLEGLE